MRKYLLEQNVFFTDGPLTLTLSPAEPEERGQESARWDCVRA